MPDQSTGPSSRQSADPSASSSPAADGKQRPRRRWGRIIGIGAAVGLVLLGLLVALLPALLSTGIGRGIAVSQINGMLNGRVEIQAWSLAWGGPIRVQGVRVFDDQKVLIFSANEIKTDLGVWDAITGNYDLGETLIDRPDLHRLVIAADGSTNLEDLVKPSAEPSAPDEAGPTDLSAFSSLRGNIRINAPMATVSVAGVPEVIKLLDASAVTIAIPQLNQPITNDISLVLTVNDEPPGTISLAGVIDAIRNNQLDTTAIAAQQTLSIEQLRLVTLAPILRMAGVDLTATGIANGQLAIDGAAAGTGSIKGELVVTDPVVTGAALNGDTLALTRLTIPVDISLTGAGDAQQLAVNTLRLDSPLATVSVSGSAPLTALLNASALTAPGGNGSVGVAISVPDAGALTNQLKNTIPQDPSLQITSGQLDATTTVTLDPQTVVVEGGLALRGLAGTSNGRPVALQPITLDYDVTPVFAGGEIADLRDVYVNLVSSFARIEGGGANLAALQFSGNADLDRATAQLAPLGVLPEGQQYGGVTRFTVSTSGDPRQGDIAVALEALAENLRLVGVVDGAPIEEPRARLDARATLARSEQGVLTRADVSSLVLATGPENQPLIDLAASASYDLAAGQLTTADVSRLAVASLPAAIERYRPVLGGALDSLRITTGSLQASLALSQTGDTYALTRPVEARIGNLTAAAQTADGRFVEIARGEDVVVSADAVMSPAAITVKSARLDSPIVSARVDDALLQLGGSSAEAPVSPLQMLQRGTVTVAAPQLGKLQALADAFATPSDASGGAASASADTPPLKVEQGALRATIAVTATPSGPSFRLSDTTVENLALAQGDQRYAFDRPITLAAAGALAAAPGDAATIDRLSLDELSGNLGGLGELSLPQPLVIANLGSTPTAAGQVRVSGPLPAVLELAEFLSGPAEIDPSAAPPAPLAYAGEYALTQALSTQAAGDSSTITLAGDLALTNLRITQGGQPLVAEDRLAVTNNLAVTTRPDATVDVAINALAVNTASSGAVNLTATGVIRDATGQRVMPAESPLVIKVAYDAPKLIALLRPFAAEALADIDNVSGQHEETYTIIGAYPADLPFNQAIRQLTVTGGLQLAGLRYRPYDISITRVSKPFRLEQGVLSFVGDGALAQINDGQLFAPGRIDLTTETPTFTSGPSPLVQNLTVTPAMIAGGPGQYIPLMGPGAKAGKVSVSLVSADRLPLDFSNSGRAEALVSITDVQPGGQIINQLTQSFGNVQNSLGVVSALVKDFDLGGLTNPAFFTQLQGEIRDARFVLENGVLTQDTTIAVGDKLTPAFTMRGGINLQSLSYRDFNLVLREHIIGLLPGNVKNALGQSFAIPLSGSVTQPKLNLDARSLVASLTRSAVPGGAPGGGGGSDTERILGTVGEILGGNRNQPGNNPPRGDQPIGQPAGDRPADQSGNQSGSGSGGDRSGNNPAPADNTQPRRPSGGLGGLLDIVGQEVDRQREEDRKREEERRREDRKR